jgi:hypothetical protein
LDRLFEKNQPSLIILSRNILSPVRESEMCDEKETEIERDSHQQSASGNRTSKKQKAIRLEKS